MAVGETQNLVREAVGVLDSAEELESAIDDLLSAGFSRAELSLLSSEHAVSEKLGHMFERVEEVEDLPDVPRRAYISRESLGAAEGGLIGGLIYVGAICAAGAVVATGAGLPLTAVAAAVWGGAGGFIGAELARWLDDSHAERIQEQLDRGGLLLWVRTRDAAHEARAVEILSRHSAHDVHVHGLPDALPAPRGTSDTVGATR
jgi:outer membrane lipoprotein SlyB